MESGSPAAGGSSSLPGAAGGRGPAGSSEGQQQPRQEELEAGGEEAPEDEAAESDWSFIACEMEAVALRDLPSALIACSLDPRVFQDILCRASS